MHDICDTGVVLYQLTYQVNWELVTLCIHKNIPVAVKNASEYMKDHILQTNNETSSQLTG